MISILKKDRINPLYVCEISQIKLYLKTFYILDESQINNTQQSNKKLSPCRPIAYVDLIFIKIFLFLLSYQCNCYIETSRDIPSLL